MAEIASSAVAGPAIYPTVTQAATAIKDALRR
jgi:hypothetical protein